MVPKAYCGLVGDLLPSVSLKRIRRGDYKGKRVASFVASVVREERLTVRFSVKCWISHRIYASCSVISFSVGDALMNTDSPASRAPSQTNVDF